MTIDPAIRGTTFAAALEAAERDEQRKRETRVAEQKAGVVGQARLIAEEFRRQHQAPIRDLDNRENRVRQRASGIDPILSDDDQTEEILMTDTLEFKLSTLQISVLKRGMITKEFSLIGGEVGKSSGQLIARGLIVPVTKGVYRLSDEGRAAYQKILDAQIPAEAEALMTSKPMPLAITKPTTPPKAASSDLETAALRLQLHQVNTLANERGEKMSQLQAEIKTLKQQIETTASGPTAQTDTDQQSIEIEDLRIKLDVAEYELSTWKRAESALKPMMAEDDTGLNLVEWITWLRLEREHLAQQIITQGAAPDTSPAIDWGQLVITPLLDFIGRDYPVIAAGDLPTMIVGYVQWLRDRLQTQETTTGINWYSVVIAPLLDLIAKHDGDEIRLQIEDDPDRIVRWASTMRQSLSNMDDIADERAKTIEQKDGQIESLRRCVDELRLTADEWQRRAATTDQTQRAAFILNELCSYLPAVDEYRRSREQSLKVIDSLTAQFCIL